MTEIISTPKAELVAARRLAAQLAGSNAALWAETYLRVESGEPFSFARHKYQLEPMCLSHPHVAIRKATQGGWTLLVMLRMLHEMIHGRVRQGVIYLFPTDVKVGEFSQLRWTPLIDNNPGAIGAYLQRTNNVHNKRILRADGRGGCNLMMRGAQLSHGVQGVERESVALRSDPGDVVVFDERDLMPDYAIGKARGRLGHSQLQWEWSLSNPTIDNFGIDALYLAGDQRNWGVRCGACNHWTFLEVEFPGCLRRQADGRVIRACVKCGRELDIDQGQWVPKFRERSAEQVSYWWSQLNSHYVDPGLILQEYGDPPEGNLGDVKRLRLGVPHLDSQAGLTAQQVLLCCTQEPMAASSTIATAMGVDVGAKLHVVLGYRLLEDAYRIVALVLADSWDQLKITARTFANEVACIDNEPELRGARDYQAAARAQVWLSDYVQSVQPASYQTETRIVRVNRNEALDMTHYYLTHPGRLLLPRETDLVTDFARHCSHMARIVTKDPLTGKQQVQWITRGGPDHWRHAFVNFLLAAKLQVPTMVSDHTRSERPHRSSYDLFEGRR
jgi:hypothetical protein